MPTAKPISAFASSVLRLLIGTPICASANRNSTRLFAALAPRAVLVVGRDQDQGMPVAGLRQLERTVSAAYQKRGIPERFAVHLTPGDHNYSAEMFAAVTQWFTRFLKP